MDHNLKQLWEDQLNKEYENILWQYKIKLRKPIISIVDVQSYWGQWHPQNRTIKMSQNLIHKQRWDIVLHVLKHEIAHQIVTELFADPDSTHGKRFHEACDMLAIPTKYRSSEVDIFSIAEEQQQSIVDDPSAETVEIKILKRIEKLMSLAQSTNEHEAILAMEKVFELYEKYNLEKIQNHKPTSDDYSYVIIELNSKKVEVYQSYIASILENHYFVKVVYSSLYYPMKNDFAKTIEVFGQKENVKMAEYVFHFLQNEVRYLWKEFSKQNSLQINLKKSYMIGLLDGFDRKLNQLKQKRTHDHKKALVLVEKDPNIDEVIHTRFPRLRKKSASANVISQNVYQEGKSRGNQIVVHKGVTSHEKSKKALPTVGRR